MLYYVVLCVVLRSAVCVECGVALCGNSHASMNVCVSVWWCVCVCVCVMWCGVV